MAATELLDDYNYYRMHTAWIHKNKAQGRYIRYLKLNKAREKSLEEMEAWCIEHGFDPRLWLYSLFKSRKWLYPPRFDHLISEKNIDRFKALTDSRLYGQRVQQEITQSDYESGNTFDLNRDISYTAEAIKRRYIEAGDAQRCMDEMTERTYGFHPRSTVCARCPAQQQCQNQLQAGVPYDIVALRNGDLDIQTARQLAVVRPHART